MKEPHMHALPKRVLDPAMHKRVATEKALSEFRADNSSAFKKWKDAEMASTTSSSVAKITEPGEDAQPSMMDAFAAQQVIDLRKYNLKCCDGMHRVVAWRGMFASGELKTTNNMDFYMEVTFVTHISKEQIVALAQGRQFDTIVYIDI
jgi:hypothetical protein